MALFIKGKRRKSGSSGGGHFRLLRKFFRPRFLLMVALFFCWDVSNGITSSLTNFRNTNNSNNKRILVSSQHHHHQHHQDGHDSNSSPSLHVKDFQKFLLPQNKFQQRLAELLAENPPTSINSADGDQEMTRNSDGGESEGTESHNMADPDSIGPVGGIGNLEAVKSEMKRKKKQDCGMPEVAVRSFMKPDAGLLKLSYFANTLDQMEEKRQADETVRTRLKREINNDGPLPWTCETKYEWEDKGADHYPRFVRTAQCKSRFCFNGFFRCKPRRYKTKVLKRLTGNEVASCEEDDVSLPETLRSTWKFVTVTINLCCDCTSRVPGSDT